MRYYLKAISICCPNPGVVAKMSPETKAVAVAHAVSVAVVVDVAVVVAVAVVLAIAIQATEVRFG